MLRLSAVVFGLSTSAALATGFSLPVKSLNGGVLEAPGDDRTGRVATDDPAAISAQEQQSLVEEDLPIDGDVVGLVNAQSQEAARFAMQMTDHVRQRLEGLRDANCHAIDLGLRLNVTDVTDGGSQNPLIIDNRRDQSFELGSGSLARQASVACGDDPVAAWTGGFLSVGSFETTGADILDFTTVGLASGLDLRVSPNSSSAWRSAMPATTARSARTDPAAGAWPEAYRPMRATAHRKTPSSTPLSPSIGWISASDAPDPADPSANWVPNTPQDGERDTS